MSPAHKKLQTRMEQMRKFRRQHEQLRTVIVRVLRPTVVKTTTLADGDTADLKPEMDAADLNAIEEVWRRLLLLSEYVDVLVDFILIVDQCLMIGGTNISVVNDLGRDLVLD